MFLASIHDTPFHAVAYHVKEVLLRKRTIHRQEHTWCSLLYQQTGFDQAAVRIAPTPCNGEPMCTVFHLWQSHVYRTSTPGTPCLSCLNSSFSPPSHATQIHHVFSVPEKGGKCKYMRSLNGSKPGMSCWAQRRIRAWRKRILRCAQHDILDIDREIR